MTDRVLIPMLAGVVDQFEAAALARGTTLDELVEGALRELPALRPVAPQPVAITSVKIVCRCCPPSGCQHSFSWRGAVRCGCTPMPVRQRAMP